MKKTLIALMALAGVACGETITLSTIDAKFVSAPALAGNCWAGDYTFTFTLTDDYTLEGSGSVVGFYRGSAVNDTYGYNAIVLGGSDEALTLTVGRGRAFETVDNATGIDADTYFTFASGATDKVTFTTQIVKGVEYTLTVTGASEAMTPTLSWGADSSETLASYNGNMNGNAALTCVVNTGTITKVIPDTPSVPEPATATLSLLALAGLASRRRRK